MKQTEPKYQVGDIVRHKVSGEKGIITHILTGCTVHSAHFVCMASSNLTRCHIGFTGRYQVEYGFAKTAIVQESHIEKA